MNTIIIETPLETSRAKRLKAATSDTHERLDKSIMAANPFENRERYGCFLQVQHQFHRAIDTLYLNSELNELLPGLADRRRLGLIEQDLKDLGVVPPVADDSSGFRRDGADKDLPGALGWLYVAEGSNLGAAFLLKEAAKLGLSESFGARHLAAAPEGRGLHWRSFTAALDAVKLSDSEDARVMAAADAAFSYVQELTTRLLAGAANAG
jgi:heme oxygenase (biliverdin-IX-beta and delta-forming)